MKKINCLFLFLSVLSLAGGDIIPVNKNSLIEVKVEVDSKKSFKVDTKPILKDRPNLQKEENSFIKPLKSEGYYIGLSLAYTSLDGIINGNTLNNGHPMGLISKFGYDFNKNFGLEVRVGTGISKDKVSIATNELSQLVAVYMKPSIEVNTKVKLFSLLGYGAIKQKINNISLGSRGISYGIGASLLLNREWSLVADAVRHETKTISNNDTYGLGLEYKF